MSKLNEIIKELKDEKELNISNVEKILKKYLNNVDDDYDYGIISYKHRFSMNRSLDDYEVTTLHKCIRTSLELKYKNMKKDELIYEFQILYKDIEDRLQCVTLNLHDYTIDVEHKGDMQLHI